MRILVCNDDGIEAPGLARLVSAASLVSEDIWVVAPDAKRTAASASLTIAKPLTMIRKGNAAIPARGHRPIAS